MKATSHLLRSLRASTLCRTARSSLTTSRRLTTIRATTSFQTRPQRSFSTTIPHSKGLQPDSSDPAPPKTEPSHTGTDSSAAQISDAEYHELADQYLNSLVLGLEELAESNSEGIEAEFSAGVLTVTHPNNGTYVLNKQPPNRQIWLSSPISGPKRFDWVIPSASQSHKHDSTIDHGDGGDEGGKWIYLRDGTALSEVLKKELGVEFTVGGGDGDGAGGGGGRADDSAP